jgi:hypothetical protein
VYALSPAVSVWSTRSRPHDGGFSWVALMVNFLFCTTLATDGSAARRLASVSERPLAEKPSMVEE